MTISGCDDSAHTCGAAAPGPAAPAVTRSTVVVGQVARDLVLLVDEVPPAGGSAPVRRRREMLGGKGANQAVALAQLGRAVSLIGVVGADPAGEAVLAQARRDGIDVGGVITRTGAVTSLLVDVVDGHGRRRLLEDTPDAVLLSAADVDAAAHLISPADTVVVQSQQTGGAVLAALRVGRAHGCRTVLDGAPEPRVVQEALRLSDVVRANEQEAGLLTGQEVTGAADARAAARRLLAAGPSVVVLAAGADGNVVAWPDGARTVPLREAEVVDRTGAGDVAVAALVAALQDGRSPVEAAELAAAAQADTVQRLGGRPALDTGGADVRPDAGSA